MENVRSYHDYQDIEDEVGDLIKFGHSIGNLIVITNLPQFTRKGPRSPSFEFLITGILVAGFLTTNGACQIWQLGHKSARDMAVG